MAKKSEPSLKYKQFQGLNNKAEPRAMGDGELSRADNVDHDDRNRLRRRRGHDLEYTPIAQITAAWNSQDESRMFIVDDGNLMEYLGDGGTRVLESSFPRTEAYFTDAGDRYFVSCGGTLGFIGESGYQTLGIPSPGEPSMYVTPGALGAGRRLVATVLEAPDGRQGGASRIQSVDLEADQGLQIIVYGEAGYLTRVYVSGINGDQLRHVGTTADGALLITNDWQVNNGEVLDQVQIDAGTPPIPEGPIVYHDGSLYVAVVDRPGGLSYLFKSVPFWPHLFVPWVDVETVPGQVRMLASTPAGIVIGTDRSIFIVAEGRIVEAAKYGAVGGQNAYYDTDSQNVYFWTEEGVCKALPFENLTQDRVSAAPGDRCYVGMVSEGGFDRLLVGTQIDNENTASNPR